MAMAANKNVVKIGLRVLAAITLIYLIYSLIPSTPSTPKGYTPHYDAHADDGFVREPVKSIPTPPSKPDSYSHDDPVNARPDTPYSASVVANPDPFPGDHYYGSTTSLPLATHAIPVVPTSTSKNPSKWTSVQHSDTSLPTPIKHLTLTNSNHNMKPASLLVLVMTKDADSWGSKDRNFSSFLEMLEWTELPAADISLAFLTSSPEEFETYRSNTINTDYASVHLMLHPGYKNSGGSRGFRHSSNIQHARRVEMARLRNYATLTSLTLSHEHILWIDADVFELSTGLIQNMLKLSAKHPQAGIQTAISLLGDGDGDYDWNAWKGERSHPDEKQREKLRKDKGSWTADSVSGKSKHMGDLRDEFRKARDQGTLGKSGKAKGEDEEADFENGGAFDPSKAEFDDDEEEGSETQAFNKADSPDEIEGLFRLDAVGATVLLMKASLWRQGLSFATSYLVGTDWGDEGWDGVESEGLCVTSRNLINEEYGRQGGIGCWGVVEGYSRHSSG